MLTVRLKVVVYPSSVGLLLKTTSPAIGGTGEAVAMEDAVAVGPVNQTRAIVSSDAYIKKLHVSTTTQCW
jgi:hypothetical protein